MSELTVVLLAAGNARRYGAPKLLERFHGETLIRRAALSALAVCPDVIVVTGAYAEDMRGAVQDLPLHVLHHPRWLEGMGSSIAAAARHVQQRRHAPDAVLLTAADVPLVGPQQLQQILATHAQHPLRIVASQLTDEVQGPPCLFPRPYLAELAELQGAQGARALLLRHASQVIGVPMPEAAHDIDTPEDLQQLRKHYPEQRH